MIKVETLETVCKGLEMLMKKYKHNSMPGDKEKYEATKQAHMALRKVVLTMTIKGDIINIVPQKNGQKYGWSVLEGDSNMKNYSA